MLCQMTGSSFLQNTTNSRFLYLVYQIRKLPMQRTIDYWSLLLCARKHGNNSWAAELLHCNDSVWNTTPKTLHLWRQFVQNNPCETRPFLHRTVAHLPKFHQSCDLVIFFGDHRRAQWIEQPPFEFWSTSLDRFAIGSDLAVPRSRWLPLPAWVPTFSGWYFVEMVSMVSMVSTTQRQLSLMVGRVSYFQMSLAEGCSSRTLFAAYRGSTKMGPLPLHSPLLQQG